MEPIYNTKTAREEFAATGEDWLLRKLRGANINTIFDVGSNKGEWTRMAKESFPSAYIHTFEIMPEVYRKFIDNNVLGPNIFPNGFGLGEEIGTIQMKYCVANDTLNTHLGMLSPGSVTDMPFHWRECLTSTGDSYMKHHKIDRVDFLKIDVEGAEHLVMKGFIETMTAGNVGCIQFEYGTANIVARWLLVDANEFLSPLGYVFGKLKPGGVAFKPYDLNDENFFGPNIVAVHRNRHDILTALST
jgi:FkbM family methyltransferase